MIILDRVYKLVADHNKYSTKVYGCISRAPNCSPKKWLAPYEEVIKIKCDVSLLVEGWVGLAAVARNDKGDVLFAGVKRMRGRWPPVVAEGMAVRLAVRLGSRYGLKKVVIESDCQGIISRLKAAATYFSDLDKILDDIFRFSLNFDFISWSHVKREGNFVAHYFAKLVPFGDEQIWNNSCPNDIAPYVRMNVLSLDSD